MLVRKFLQKSLNSSYIGSQIIRGYKMVIDLPDDLETELKLKRIQENENQKKKKNIANFGISGAIGLSSIVGTNLFMGIPLTLDIVGLSALLNPGALLNGTIGFAAVYGIGTLFNKIKSTQKNFESEELKHDLIKIAEEYHRDKLSKNSKYKNDNIIRLE